MKRIKYGARNKLLSLCLIVIVNPIFAFLYNLHSLLTKQQLYYAIIIIEQIADQTFNRAKLMNVGFAEGMKLYSWECFIFHDVDLLPEDDHSLYSCPTIPRHVSVADKFNYKNAIYLSSEESAQ